MKRVMEKSSNVQNQSCSIHLFNLQSLPHLCFFHEGKDGGGGGALNILTGMCEYGVSKQTHIE